MEIFFTGLIVISSVTILLTWVVIRAIEREEEHLYDKSKVKYTDGDNT